MVIRGAVFHKKISVDTRAYINFFLFLIPYPFICPKRFILKHVQNVLSCLKQIQKSFGQIKGQGIEK